MTGKVPQAVRAASVVSHYSRQQLSETAPENVNPKARAVRITLALVRANDAGQLANGINERSICLATGKSLSPRSSLRLALPILAGTPRNAPTPADAGILLGRTDGAAAAALGLRSATGVHCGWRRLRPLRSRRLRRFVARARPFGGIAFLRRLRTRHRRLAALRPAPTPPAFSCGRCAPRRVLRAGPAPFALFAGREVICAGCARRSSYDAQTPRGFRSLALVAPLAHA